MRLALAQINTTVGDLDGNRGRILEAIGEAKGAGADLVLLPELAVTGYPPEDLLLRPGFIRAAEASLREEVLAGAPLDDGSVDPRQRQLAGQHQPRGPSPNDQYGMLGHSPAPPTFCPRVGDSGA